MNLLGATMKVNNHQKRIIGHEQSITIVAEEGFVNVNANGMLLSFSLDIDESKEFAKGLIEMAKVAKK